jgi:hypothetical protein
MPLLKYLAEIAKSICKYIFSNNKQVDGLLFHLYNVPTSRQICKIYFEDACHNKIENEGLVQTIDLSDENIPN